MSTPSFRHFNKSTIAQKYVINIKLKHRIALMCDVLRSLYYSNKGQCDFNSIYLIRSIWALFGIAINYSNCNHILFKDRYMSFRPDYFLRMN